MEPAVGRNSRCLPGSTRSGSKARTAVLEFPSREGR